jgi:putative heme transporter
MDSPPLQAIAGWALAVSAIMSTSALAVVLVAGAIAGGRSVASVAGLAGAVFFLLPAAAVLLALRYRRVRAALNRLLGYLIGRSRRLLRWPGEGAARSLEDVLERIAQIRMPPRDYAKVFGLALLNWLGDCACLACALAAVLTYRLVSFWMILIGGWATMIFLTRAKPARLRSLPPRI